MMKMYTLGHSFFMPSGIHAGEACSWPRLFPIVSAVHEGLVVAWQPAKPDLEACGAMFARTEGILPAPDDACHKGDDGPRD